MTCPFPRYWMCHIAVALLIAIGVALVFWLVVGLRSAIYMGLTAGATYYIGREITQWESGLPFDWKGLMAPVLVNLAILIGSSFVKGV